MAGGVPLTESVVLCPAQMAAAEALMLTTGRGFTMMVCVTGAEVHPPWLTVRLTDLLPGVGQLTEKGPCTFPGAGVPPPTFQV